MLTIPPFSITIYLYAGVGTHHQKRRVHEYRPSSSGSRLNEGRTPMTKNIRVTDESGRDYGCTYPRRAKGLVKNGRARFVDENVICLACPPNQSQTNDLEEALMFDKKETPVNPNTNFNNDPGFPPPAVDPQQSVPQQPIPMAGGAPQDCSPVDISSEYILNQNVGLYI